MIEQVVLTIVIIAFLFACYEDIKKREVYDYINYSFAFLIIILGLFDSFLQGSMQPIKYVSFGLFIGFLLGSILYYIGIWGGGDAKFMIGFGASGYYLLSFLNHSSPIGRFYEMVMLQLSDFLSLALSYLLEIVLIIDLIFLVLVLIKFFFIKNRENLKANLQLFLILFSLFLGLDLRYEGFYLFVFGFIAFFFIFIAHDNVFLQIYVYHKKKIKDLKEGMHLGEDVKINNELKVERDKSFVGLTREDVNMIKKTENDERLVKVKYILPFGMLVAINFFLYVMRIVSLDSINLEIMSFLLEFLFFSFLAGGVLAILILLIVYILKWKKVKVKLNKNHYYSFAFILVLALGLSFIDLKFLYFLIFIPVILFVVIAKELEKIIFIKKKPIDKVVYGDWIVQEIVVDKEKIYTPEDFRLGVTEEQLNRLRELSKHHRNLKKLLVKDGLAFLPPLFIGFLIVLIL
ncbi:MAG: prepilin peptidase [Nanoarchaeota archaeon]